MASPLVGVSSFFSSSSLLLSSMLSKKLRQTGLNSFTGDFSYGWVLNIELLFWDYSKFESSGPSTKNAGTLLPLPFIDFDLTSRSLLSLLLLCNCSGVIGHITLCFSGVYWFWITCSQGHSDKFPFYSAKQQFEKAPKRHCSFLVRSRAWLLSSSSQFWVTW